FDLSGRTHMRGSMRDEKPDAAPIFSNLDWIRIKQARRPSMTPIKEDDESWWYIAVDNQTMHAFKAAPFREFEERKAADARDFACGYELDLNQLTITVPDVKDLP